MRKTFALAILLVLAASTYAIQVNGPLTGASLEKLSTAPSIHNQGRIYYDTTQGLPVICDGVNCNNISSLTTSSAVAHQYLTGFTAPATFTRAQPNCGDLSDGVASCSTDTTNASNISSGTLGASRLPNPSATTLGGIQSAAAQSNKWINSISTLGVPSLTQPACGNLSNGAASCSTDTTNASNISSGTLGASRLPNPSSTTLGGIESYAAVSNQWINTISTSGVPSSTQPAFSNISGSVAASQLPNPTASTLGGIESYAAVTSQWINAISTSGVPASTQPAFTDISGTASTGQIPDLSATYLKLTGGTMSGAVNMGTHLINAVTDPSSAQDAATKNYVDTQLSYLNPADSVYAASIATVAGTYVNAVSGVCIGDTFTTTATTAFALDGQSPAIGARVLLKDQTNSFQDGVWTLTTQAVGGVSGAILTRALDDDSAADFNAGQIIPIANGTVNAGRAYFRTNATITTCNTGTQTWTLFARASADYLLKASNLSDVSSASTSFNNIAPVTSTGDLIIGNGANSSTRLAKGTQYQVVQATATTAAYDAVHLDQSAAITGTLPVANGGTGQTTYTNGQLLIGNTTGNTLAKSTLTAGSNITITNGTGTITIASTASSGTLTIATKTSNYTMQNTDDVILCDASSGAFTITMQSASTATAKVYRISKIDKTLNQCNIAFNGSDAYGAFAVTALNISDPDTGVAIIPDGGTKWYGF